MGPLRNIVQATLTSQGFQVVSTLISLVAVPLYLRHLGVERYGLFLTAQAWAGYLGFSNASLSQSTMILVSHAAGRGDTNALSRIVRTSITISLVSATLVIVLALGIAEGLRSSDLAESLKLDHPEVPGLVLAIGLQVVTVVMFSTFYDLLIGLQKASRASIFQGVSRVTGQLAGLGLVLRGASLGAITAATALTTAVVGLACVGYARREHPQAFVRAPVTREQVVLQLRTGAKSLGLQLGATLAGTAPTLVLATVAGPAAVPLYAVPARIFTIGTSLVNSFSALMQPAFGDAFARGDLPWIRSALLQLWEKTLLVMAVAAAGLIGVGGPLIHVWTGGKIDVSTAMLASVAMGGIATALAPVKFLLSGINRHRSAALTEVTNGVLAMGFSVAAVGMLSPEWVGLGALLGSACTSAWILPMQAKHHLQIAKIVPPAGNLARIVACALAVYGATLLVKVAGHEFAPNSPWLILLASIFFAAATGLLCAVGLNLLEWRALYNRFRAQRT